MGFILQLILSAVAVLLASWLLPGVHVDGFGSAIIVAIVLGILNAVVKPVLTVLTLPITILTLGLFYLVLNVLMVYLADALIGGFEVAGFFSALFFSIILAVLNSILGNIAD